MNDDILRNMIKEIENEHDPEVIKKILNVMTILICDVCDRLKKIETKEQFWKVG